MTLIMMFLLSTKLCNRLSILSKTKFIQPFTKFAIFQMVVQGNTANTSSTYAITKRIFQLAVAGISLLPVMVNLLAMVPVEL
jgi:hypothetical protein